MDITLANGTVISNATIDDIAAIMALTSTDGPAVTPKKAQPASLVAAKTHCYEARMARRANTDLGGLTKAERSALYAEHPELSAMSKTARAKAWKAIVVAYKAA